jgi:Amt family ammonium transporter
MIAQLQDIGITLLWSAFVAFVIMTILKHTIGIRASDEDQEQGLDLADHDEKTYNL